MKRLLMLLFLFVLVGCSSTDDTLLRDTLSGMGSYSYLDTEFEEEFSGEYFKGDGSFVLVYGDQMGVMYFDEYRAVLIEMYYETKLFSDAIRVTEINLTYTDYKSKVYVEVSFWEEEFDGGYSVDDYIEMFEGLDVEMIRDMLADSHFLDKK